MIALDTNVVVRVLVEDDEAQTRRAKELFRKAIAADDLLHVADVVVVEVAWVLSAVYGFGRAEIAGALRRVLVTKHMRFESPDGIARALIAFEGGKGDFADYLIRERSMAVGCTAVATFERALLKEPGFVAP